MNLNLEQFSGSIFIDYFKLSKNNYHYDLQSFVRKEIDKIAKENKLVLPLQETRLVEIANPDKVQIKYVFKARRKSTDEIYVESLEHFIEELDFVK